MKYLYAAIGGFVLNTAMDLLCQGKTRDGLSFLFASAMCFLCCAIHRRMPAKRTPSRG